MLIKNKMESYNNIIKLNLNRFPEELFVKNQQYKVEEFISKYPVNYYAVRSKDAVGYKTKIKIPKNMVIDEIMMHDNFTVSVSSYNYSENLLLIGDINIDSENNVWLFASSTDYPYKFTDKLPEYNLCTDIFDKRLNRIAGFDTVYEYIVNKGLLDIIVEFALYDKPVGVLNERIIVFELRTDY